MYMYMYAAFLKVLTYSSDGLQFSTVGRQDGSLIC